MKTSLLVATRSSITRSMRTSSARPARSVSRRIRSPSEGTNRRTRIERQEGTIGFQLQAVEAQPGQTRIRMKPSSFLVGMLVDPVYFTFESGTGKLVRLEGRVPPKVRAGKGWRDFDARVEYRYVAGEYKYLAKAAGAGRLPPRILGGLAANPGPP